MQLNNLMLGADNSASTAPRSVRGPQKDPEASHLAKNTNSCSTPFILPKGIWFDWGWDLRGEAGDAFVEQVIERITPFEKLERKRSERKTNNHRNRVRSILANALRALWFFQPPWVAYFVKPDANPYKLANKPGWFYGSAMKDSIDLMASAGLLNTSLGENGAASSVYKMTQTLFVEAMEAGVNEHNLKHNIPLEALIRLCKSNGNDVLLNFKHNEETRRWVNDLDAFNAFIAKQDIALKLTEAEEQEQVAMLNESRGLGYSEFDTRPVYYRPELMKTALYRKFNNGSFDQGGRLYGGWWQNIVSGNRKKIIINGNPTVELDYSGYAIHMLYHQRNKQCEGYPYTLDSISAEQEKEIKELTLILINDTKKVREGRLNRPFNGKLTVGQVLEMLEERHAPICDAFYSGEGIFLQRKDADIALSIITSLREKGIVALPVHDSFIVAIEHEEELRKQMMFWYKNEFGYDPIIK